MKFIPLMACLCHEARSAHCRIKEWKFSEPQALQLADEISISLGRSAQDIFEGMKTFGGQILGARIRISTTGR